MLVLLALIAFAAVLLVVWAALAAEDTQYDNDAREPVFVPAQRPGGDH